jgi:membrane protease YdiL (CAAX protease family)
MLIWFLNDQGTVRSGWKVFGFFLLLLALVVVAADGLRALGRPQVVGPWLGAVLGALASLLCVKLEGRRFSSLGFLPGRRWLFECLAGVLGGTLLILVTALLVRGMDGFHWERTPGIGVREILSAAWPLLGVAFNEEIFARGYPFQRLVEGAGPWVGQLVLAGLFALAHMNNPGMHGATLVWGMLNIGLAAILLGFCYLRTRSLALPIGVHLGWNWTQGSLLGFGVSGTTVLKGAWTPVFHGRPEWITGGTFGLEASLPCALVCGAAILGVWRWKGSRPAREASIASASM